jgi:hypothetical protein
MGGFVLYGIVGYSFGLGLIEAILARYQLSTDWVPAFVLPMLIPNLEVSRRLWKFRCPACNGRFMGSWGGTGLFRKTCAACGAAVGTAAKLAT